MSRRRRERERVRGDVGPIAAESNAAAQGLVFTRWTGIFGGAGLVTVFLGFFFLVQGSLALAPVLLILGFLFFFPLALIK